MEILKKIFLICLILTFGWASLGWGVAPTTVKMMQEAAIEGVLAGYSCNNNGLNFLGFDASGTKYICSGVRDVATGKTTQTEYPFLETAGVFQICSSGTDEATVTVTYLDSNWNRQTIDLELDGNTVVDGTTAIRVEKVCIKDYAVSNDEPVGYISVFKNGASITSGVPDDYNDVFCQITPGTGVSHSLVVSTARNELYILQGIESHAFSTADFVARVWKRPLGKNQYFMLGVPFERNSSLKLAGEAYIGEKTDFWVTCESSSSTTQLLIKTRGYRKQTN